MAAKELVKGEDYYFDEGGLFVFTAKYHRERGFCCGYECRECPFGYDAVAEPRRTQLLSPQPPGKNNGEIDGSLG